MEELQQAQQLLNTFNQLIWVQLALTVTLSLAPAAAASLAQTFNFAALLPGERQAHKRSRVRAAGAFSRPIDASLRAA